MSAGSPAKPSAFTPPSAPEKPHVFTPKTAQRAAALPPVLDPTTELTSFATRLPPGVQRLLKTACAEKDMRMQDAVYAAIWQWLNTNAT